MPQQNPTPGARHVNSALTDFALQVVQGMEKYTAKDALPIVPVRMQSDYYYEFSTADWHRDEAGEITPGTEAPEGGYNLSTELYNAKRRGFRTQVTDEDMANSDDVLMPFEDATMFVKHKTMLNKDRVVFGEIMKASTWTGSSTGGDITLTNKWGTSNSDPVSDILTQADAIEEKTGHRPNKLVLGREAFTALKTNDNILSRITGIGSSTMPARVMRTALAELFELDDVVPVASIRTTTKEGATTPASDFIVGDSGLLMYSPMGTIGRRSITAAVIFNWTGFLGANAEGMRIRTWREEREASDWVQAETAFAVKVTDPSLGAYFPDLV